jgi:cell division protein FtsI (penicillin-binding protein 3)
LQIAKGYSIVTNGGYDIKPTIIKKKLFKKDSQKRILNMGVSEKINKILRKVVTNEEGTAELANIKGYEVGGKTGTAQISKNGRYTRDKINTFVAVFPSQKPKFTLVVMLDEPKTNSEYVYYYRNGKEPTKGTPYNTAGWTSVEVAGKIIERIGPILATKYMEN